MVKKHNIKMRGFNSRKIAPKWTNGLISPKDQRMTVYEK